MTKMRYLFLLPPLIFACKNNVRNSNSSTLKDTSDSKITEDKGSTFSIKSKLGKTNKSILVSSGQFSNYEVVTLYNCDFNLVLNNQDTIYLSTSDRKFITPEGYKIGTMLNELPNKLKLNLVKELGWGYSYKLPSGWAIAFCEGSSCTDNYPKNNSKVKWIFKRS